MSTRAAATGYYRLGGPGGNAWEAALSTQPGRVVEVDGGGSRDGRLRAPLTYATWQETLATFVDSTDGRWLRPFFVPDTLNLARDGIRDRVAAGDRNLAISGLCSASNDRLRVMFDGDPTTATFFRMTAPGDPSTQIVLAQNVLVDLGTDYPVRRVRFFPRLGRERDHTRVLLERMAAPKLRLDDLGDLDYAENRLPWFELSGASNATGIPSDCSEAGRSVGWFAEIPREVVNTENDPRLTILDRNLDSKQAIIDVSFPVRPLQWVALRPLDVLKDYEIAELQVFGQGHVPRAVYTTTILDLGAPMALGRLRWWGQQPPGADAELRTRSGHDDDPLQYWVSGFAPGEYVEASRQEYLRAPASQRKTTDDREGWSPWSAPYRWEDGLDPGAELTSPWQGGTPILSPGPARYLQVQVAFRSTLTAAARLRNLDVEFARPVARDVVAEIWPVEVERGVRTTFTYSLAADLVDGDAFDRLDLFTLVRADTVRSVRVDGVEQGTSAARIEADRIVAALPRLGGGRDTDKLVQVVFDARVVQFGTQFLSWVYASGASGARQLTRAGDADDAYPGNRLGVETTGVGKGPLSRVRPRPNPFTPNGDGSNDAVSFTFDVYDVTAARSLQVTIHDLSGRLVRRLEPRWVRRGVYGDGPAGPVWDGMDDGGTPVPPAVYLYRVRLDGDQGPAVQVGTVAVVY